MAILPDEHAPPVDEGADSAAGKSSDAKEKLDFEHLKLSHDYAWNWFQYHAGQRMNVFRFFFIVVAILAAGYIKALEIKHPGLQVLIALTAMVLAFLFWRADIRSYDLVKIGEAHLKQTEAALQQRLGHDSVSLASSADRKTNQLAASYPSRAFYSLKQIIRSIYLLVGVIGFVTICSIVYPYVHRMAQCWPTMV